MQEFKVNEHITLKLENGKTIIYVAGKLFRQCKYLLLEIPVDEVGSFDEIQSIDEAAEMLDHTMENELTPELLIPPEVEFWGHCSNLQAWYEQKYDPRLLHSNLAFPLLRKLTDVGDPLARQIFKEVLTKRLIGGAYAVMELLINGNYIELFNRDELWYALEDLHNNAFKSSESYISVKFYLLEKLLEMGDKTAEKIFKDGILKSLSEGFTSITYYFYQNRYIDYLSRDEFWSVFGNDGIVLHEIEKKVKKYNLINGVKIYQEHFDGFDYFKLRDGIYMESGPMVFTFEDGRITRIGIFGDEKEVSEENLDLCGERLGCLELKRPPDLIGELESLKELTLRNLGLKILPKSIENLKKLQELSVSNNPQFKIPNFIWNIKTLEILDISYLNLTTLPKSIEGLENLRELYLYGNYMESFPKNSIEKLKCLKRIALDGEEYFSRLDDKTYEWLRKKNLRPF